MARDRERHPTEDYLVDRPLNLNTASREDLATIEGIGKGRADRIVEWRERNGPFEAVDDLQRVPQFTPDVLRAVRGQFRV
jgi:competence protein ComEA